MNNGMWTTSTPARRGESAEQRLMLENAEWQSNRWKAAK